MYACILDFQPKVIERFSMTLTRNCICPMVNNYFSNNNS